MLFLSRIKAFARRHPEAVPSEATRIDLRIAEVPSPRSGERVELDGGALLIQSEPARDRQRLVWTVDLCRVSLELAAEATVPLRQGRPALTA